MKTEPNPEYLTVSQLCERWGVCRATLSIWRKKGSAGARMRLPFHKVGGKVLFSVSDCDLFWKEGCESSCASGAEARRIYKQTGEWRLPQESTPSA